MTDRYDELRAKRSVPHPKYGWLRVDMRTTAEVEESRDFGNRNVKKEDVS